MVGSNSDSPKKTAPIPEVGAEGEQEKIHKEDTSKGLDILEKTQ